jgi:aconitate hydratase
MGIIPLQFLAGESADTLRLTGSESLSVQLSAAPVRPGMQVPVQARCSSLSLSLGVLNRMG